MAGELIKQIGNVSIRAREGDHYINATELAKAAGKQWNDYARLDGTKAFLKALEAETGYPVSALVESSKGGAARGGTWIHPRVVIHFAQWASAEFAAAVTGWVLELITTGKVELKPTGGDEFRALIAQVQQLQQQVSVLAARPAELVAPALPRFTVLGRLNWRGIGKLTRDARRKIHRIAVGRIEEFSEEPLCQAGGEGGGGPSLFAGTNLVHLDHAIDAVLDQIEAKRRAEARRQLTIQFEIKTTAGAA